MVLVTLLTPISKSKETPIRYTLLDIVKSVLTEMDSQEVNSWDDTSESSQVAFMVRDLYFDFLGAQNVPEQMKLVELNAAADPSNPTAFFYPEGVSRIEWIQYNTSNDSAPNWSYMDYKDPYLFISDLQKGSVTNPDRVSVDGKYFVWSNRKPTCWTSFDDTKVIMDAFDSTVDSTLQASKSLAYVAKAPQFILENDAIPLLDDNLFPPFINKCKSHIFYVLKQQAHELAMRDYRKGVIRLTGKRSKYPTTDRPNYGRK